MANGRNAGDQDFAATDSPAPDIRAGRLPSEQYRINFDDAVLPLERQTALVEANRCYFCYDAPCMEACPTGIDIPGFIRKITTENTAGAALRIYEQNIFGGSCARVCPTEILCEQACVRNAEDGNPIRIGLLQRYATDHGTPANEHPFRRAAATGKRIAVVGGGPAGLACAHRLAMLGHAVTIFEAQPHLGGLNATGIAEYKVPHDYAGREIDFILGIGGITVQTSTVLGRDIFLSSLRRDYDAVFLGIGLAAVKSLDCEGEDLAGVFNAVNYIAQIRLAKDFATLPIGRRVVVIGGGNTAIDAAVQARRLGAEEVTLVYRRGPEAMSATGHEQSFAKENGVIVRHWAQPLRLEGHGGHVRQAVFEYTRLDADGRLTGTGETFALAADMVFKAIGQVFLPDPLREDGRDLLVLKNGRIAANAEGRTSLDNVWAGGDCVAGDQDLTVAAVQAGKVAALSIDVAMRQKAAA
ncbi:NAD(P)-dependent oxidoreductase [uncultured Ferrovibrio sp.]|jgi:dihydropyrimidine dehydrogenase (NAD+) subunit PreT|uniref:NAD(P)-dependent oxidoreductase n=1 Tax=uncultured Ferrovibrio sp. TaxID=1576913 RepID=UPI0026139EA0|nr:NAD(P)-dependent oxidoreductase [uncultured Ferrovibrio sp.]